MSEKKKSRVVHSRTAKRPTLPSVLGQFHCSSVVYEFEVPLDLFNATAFSKETGIQSPWSAVVNPQNRSSGYHVHFKGRIEKSSVSFSVEYWDWAKPMPDDVEPFAESIMQWVGSFIRVPTARSFVVARFDKPKDNWRSRFNLPFKVTMAESEVTIDGISLSLPKNPFSASAGFLEVADKTFMSGVQLVRAVEFSTFDLRKEIESFNEAIKIFLEPLQ